VKKNNFKSESEKLYWGKKMKRCMLIGLLASFCNICYALDGEGWGALIKGVTEVLHENQQQEKKQREEQQKLEQQRLQEQQTEQLRQQNLQQVNNGGSSQSCAETMHDNTLVKWSGGCVNGQLSGEGEYFSFRESQKKLRKTVTKMQNGFYVGIGLTHALEKDGAIITDIINEPLYFYENGNGHQLPLIVKINNRLQNYVYKDFDWYALAADNKHLDRQISFEEAMQIVKNFMATKSSDTMSYERFRAYLEGRLSFDVPQTVAQSSNSNSSSLDDPPVRGVTLSLGGSAKPSKKSKKKTD
jgi:hypothetical protein